MRFSIYLLIIIRMSLVVFADSDISGVKGVDLEVYIIGGTGDLARRYLWNGFFKLFQESQSSTRMRFCGAGKSDTSNAAFRQILRHSIACSNVDTRCAQQRLDFVTRSRYERLQDESSYQKICSFINSNSSNVIFYLSVPPAAYKGIIESIVKHCDVTSPKKNFKFVFEKPFGTDLRSAQSLSRMLSRYLLEGQIYRWVIKTPDFLWVVTF